TATPAAPRKTPTASYGTIPTLRAHQAFRAPVAAAEMSRMAPVSQPCASTAAAAAPLGPVSATGVVRDDDSAVRPAAGAGGGVGPDFLALDAAAAPPVLGALAGPAVPGVAP
ncbi:MAG: hypothetical protein HOQ24_19585, partial [Mycobacteriaceae bacterium]|nr:hypothetical protein [Mycobacteriaceae bacterium]